MRDKFNKFMQGRYGVDDLSRFTMGVALVLIILAMFANIFSRTVGSTLDILGVAAMSEMPHKIRKKELTCSDM